MNFKPLLLLPPLVLGIAGFMWMTSGDHQPPQTREATRLAVRVMTVTPEPMVVTATGYGRVEAERSWTAVAQVDGRVVDMAPGLAVGTLVEKDALLVQIDTTDFDLAIQKSKANIAAAEATLAELDRQEANSRRLLEVEERIRDVTQAEYDRINNLVERGTSTAAALDTVQKSLLAQENAVINLTNTLELFPAQRASAEATLAVRQAELAEAERGLENTTMTAPFRGRVSEAAVEQGQFVQTGEQLLTLDAIDAVEVVGSFQPQAFSRSSRPPWARPSSRPARSTLRRSSITSRSPALQPMCALRWPISTHAIRRSWSGSAAPSTTRPAPSAWPSASAIR